MPSEHSPKIVEVQPWIGYSVPGQWANLANGMLAVPDTPGRGYKLNEKTVKERLIA